MYCICFRVPINCLYQLSTLLSKSQIERVEKMTKTNEIAVARKAIIKAIKAGEICKEVSGMHRVAMNAISGICKNIEVASELAWCAVKDVKLS
jgi:hypothetical protein